MQLQLSLILNEIHKFRFLNSFCNCIQHKICKAFIKLFKLIEVSMNVVAAWRSAFKTVSHFFVYRYLRSLQFIDTQEKKTSMTKDLRNKEHRITLGFSSLDAPCADAYS